VSFLFISHASPDKRERVRPLVEVLIAEGELVWIDRPGLGAADFGFDRAFIDRYEIDYLLSGRSWSTSIQDALSTSGAVIGCLSQAIRQHREVLETELAFADTAKKLVTCIVDDLSLDDLSSLRYGLLDLAKHQSPRIDCRALRAALDFMAARVCSVEELPSGMRTEWEKVRGLIADANRLRPEPRPLRRADIDRISPQLSTIPVGPILRVHDIPPSLIEVLGAKVASAAKVDAALNQSTVLLRAAFPEGFSEEQILLRRGMLPPFGSLPGDVYWTQMLAAAGLKGRRTVAALLLCPISAWAFESAGLGELVKNFTNSLQHRAN
jgi:hypothetical protein